MTLPKLRLSLPLSLSPSHTLTQAHTHSLALLLLPCQATTPPSAPRHVVVPKFNFMRASHASAPSSASTAAAPLPPPVPLYLLSHSPSPYQFYWLRPIYIFKLFREVFRELCQVYEGETEREATPKKNFTCVALWWNLCVSLPPPPLPLSLTVWEWMFLTYSSVACSALKAHKNRQSKLSLNAIKRRQLQREIT